MINTLKTMSSLFVLASFIGTQPTFAMRNLAADSSEVDSSKSPPPKQTTDQKDEMQELQDRLAIARKEREKAEEDVKAAEELAQLKIQLAEAQKKTAEANQRLAAAQAQASQPPAPIASTHLSYTHAPSLPEKWQQNKQRNVSRIIKGETTSTDPIKPPSILFSEAQLHVSGHLYGGGLLIGFIHLGQKDWLHHKAFTTPGSFTDVVSLPTSYFAKPVVIKFVSTSPASVFEITGYNCTFMP